MHVQIELRGGLATKLPRGRGEIELVDGATIATVLETFGASPVTCICVRNGAPVPRDTVLRDGDRVQIVPPTAGG
jgi:sulfur carrier protein ThiS